nr:MFS transporter [Sphingomonas sp. Y57]
MAEPDPAITAPPEQEVAGRNGRYAWIVTIILLLGYSFAFVDRQMLNLLVEPIRRDFRLDDTSVSFLLGFAFVLAFAFAAPIAGRWADLGHRRNICVFAVAVWSAFTVGCGLSASYGMLFSARLGVGAAEAFLMPAAWSLIADYFSRDRLPRAMSVFLLGPYLGGGMALILGGTVVHALGNPSGDGGWHGLTPWRAAFLVAGCIGLVPILLLFLIREPARQETTAAPSFRLGAVVRHMWQARAFYGAFYGGISLQTITFYAVPAWMPTYLVRRFGVPLGDIGLEYGVIVLIMGCLGVLAGPFLGRWLVARGYRDHNMRIPVIACLGLVPVAAALPLAASYPAALAICAVLTFFCSLPMPMAAAALQTVTPNRMRGVAASLYMFIVSLVGVALPPTLIALLTDHVFHDPAKVGWSLGIVCSLAALFAALVIARGLPAYRAALAKADAAALAGTPH